ncbi:MAG TPA: PRC-barrel domain-containing protein [Stellaceae bacterium]|nr:PRC-barrel domain-containing protein [Stellaceae bacterium]
MRVMPIMAAGLFALASATATAQTTTPGAGTPPRTGSAAGAPAAAKAPAPDPLKDEDVSQVSGSAVYGSDGKKVGSVSTALMNPESRTIDRLVVSEGGLLGVGAHKVAMPIDQFKWDSAKEGFVIGKSADDLKSMAAWEDPARATTAGSGSSTPPRATAPAPAH